MNACYTILVVNFNTFGGDGTNIFKDPPGMDTNSINSANDFGTIGGDKNNAIGGHINNGIKAIKWSTRDVTMGVS